MENCINAFSKPINLGNEENAEALTTRSFPIVTMFRENAATLDIPISGPAFIVSCRRRASSSIPQDPRHYNKVRVNSKSSGILEPSDIIISCFVAGR